jgi:hypothetical protein
MVDIRRCAEGGAMVGQQRPGGDEAKPRASQPWGFDRGLALANFGLLLVGAIWVAIDWFPKHSILMSEEAAAVERPVQLSFELKVEPVRLYPDGSSLYSVRYMATETSLSKAPTYQAYDITELYVGSAHLGPMDLHNATPLNDPPDVWTREPAGPIAWKQVSYVAGIDNPTRFPDLPRWFRANHFDTIGPATCLTGYIHPGTVTHCAHDFMLRARDTDFIAVVVNIGIDGSVDGASPKTISFSDVYRPPTAWTHADLEPAAPPR